MDIVIYEYGNRKIHFYDIRRMTDRGQHIIMQDSDGNILTADKKVTEKIIIEIRI